MYRNYIFHPSRVWRNTSIILSHTCLQVGSGYLNEKNSLTTFMLFLSQRALETWNLLIRLAYQSSATTTELPGKESVMCIEKYEKRTREKWWIKDQIPWPNFKTAAVINMLKTCVNTPASKISLGVPPFQASIIMAYNKTKYHQKYRELKGWQWLANWEMQRTVTEWKCLRKSN